jgi:hypothetical protein
MKKRIKKSEIKKKKKEKSNKKKGVKKKRRWRGRQNEWSLAARENNKCI